MSVVEAVALRYSQKEDSAMKVSITLMSVVAAGLLSCPAWAQAPEPTPDCEAQRCQVFDAINMQCSGAKNHGKYVSCVARQVRQSGISNRCRGKVMRCAARSTFGKPAFETCTFQRFGTCDTTSGMCTEGTLASGLTTCAADTDCLDGTKCHTVRAFPPDTTPVQGEDKCTLQGGTPGTGSCCPTCAPQ
jgi:hypothetical protein